MAHPCIHCGSECDCSGDWDDIIVSKTPSSCEGCGCEEVFSDDDDYNDDDDDEIIGYQCLGCGHVGDNPYECDMCTGSAVDPVYF